MTVIQEHNELPARIRAASEHANDCKAKLDAARKVRDQLVAEAIDYGGMTTIEAARILDMSATQVTRILIAHSER